MLPPAIAEEATSCISQYLEPQSPHSVKAAMASFPEGLRAQQIAADKYFDPSIYAALLPLTKLIHLFENNGTAEEHAFKLTVLFGDKEKALNYIENFGKENPRSQTIHDALLFSLPPFEGCNYPAWRKMAHGT